MGHRTVECGVYEYIALLDRTSCAAPVNTTHHVLRGLYHIYGESKVDAELMRQFAEQRKEQRND